MTEATLLEQLLMARGPSGEELEVREVCQKELQQHCDETWVDDAGNLVGLIRAQSAEGNGTGGVLVMGHLDGIAACSSTLVQLLTGDLPV
ncbi:hypothetical protein [Pseudomonas sp. Pseu.R1]|uniref:hypothetical protein n=1 Tax=Pseudomonas sp. Pseu.R1 TaxID=3379818 RepID=UPI003B95FCC6